jgi:YgiT-type zinc finger domain-containing protein
MTIEDIIDAIRNNRIRVSDHADEEAGKETENMMPFNQCPLCGGEMIKKTVEKLLRGGIHTAVIAVQAEVCLHCGERLYAPGTVTRFEQIRHKLQRKEIEEFRLLGQSFQVA